MEDKTLRLGGCEVRLLPVIRGLVSESERVRRAFDSFRPDKVAISISKEELDGLRNMPDDFEPELSRYEEIYIKGLSEFGEVAAPPPCYVAALELCEHANVPIVPVDLDEQSFTDLYCAVVPGTTLFTHSTRTWLLKRRSYSRESPEKFVLQWDRTVNRAEGFRIIEQKRAEAIARGIAEACKDAERLLAVVELERAEGVHELLRAGPGRP